MNAWSAVDGLLRTIRQAPDALSGWSQVLNVCRQQQPSPLWTQLGPLDVQGDVDRAAEWLQRALRDPAAPSAPRGVYLGLNTLNMKGDDGFNVGMGATASCDPAGSPDAWMYDLPWFADNHLIRGLAGLHDVYSRPRWKSEFEFADYTLFLGYGGLVLADALQRLVLVGPCVVIWGFDEGDLFCLGRVEGDRFTRTCAEIHR